MIKKLQVGFVPEDITDEWAALWNHVQAVKLLKGRLKIDWAKVRAWKRQVRKKKMRND